MALSEDLRQRFEKLYCGVVYDAMRFDLNYSKPFILDKAIKSVWKLQHRQVLFGHAFTCKGQIVLSEEEINDKIRIEMFREFSKGCVQVIDTGGDDAVAHFGDISGKIARKFGCLGAVVDGNTRDARLLEEDQFLIFCRDVQPIDAYGRWQVVEYQTDIFLGGIQGAVSVSPNDYIFADTDGVLIIPRQLGETVCKFAEIRLAKENLIREKLKSTLDIQKLYDEIGRW